MASNGKSFSVGIIGYGAYLPLNCLKTTEVAKAWQKEEKASSAIGVKEKTVGGLDEDAVTMAVQASMEAMKRAGIAPAAIGAVFMGSESHPYAVNPSTTTVAEILAIGREYFAADLEFACKAGTAAMQIIVAFLQAGKINYGLAIGSDKAQGRPGDALEYATASGAAAFIFGKKEEEFLVKVRDFLSFTSDTPDFWRREGARYPSHGGRFTGEKAYFQHTLGAARKLLATTKTQPSDYDHVIFHMPNGKFPRKAAEILGFTPRQIAAGLIVEEVGNTYSACSLLGLCSVLDTASPKEKIFLVSYGSGAGSDAFVLETTPLLSKKRKNGQSFASMLKDKRYVDYFEYLRLTGAIRKT